MVEGGGDYNPEYVYFFFLLKAFQLLDISSGFPGSVLLSKEFVSYRLRTRWHVYDGYVYTPITHKTPDARFVLVKTNFPRLGSGRHEGCCSKHRSL